MKTKSHKQKILYAGLFAVGLFIIFFITTCFLIGRGVKTQCETAKREYKGDCVNALITLLDDENRSFGERNSAIWALGQLGDKRATLILEKYYTGNIPSKEPLNKTISQYELKKALKLANGGVNITSIFWRYNRENY